MHRISVFGKGGIGKSTLSANLAAVYAARGLKVLLVGCDPKHDTTIALTDGKPIRTVVEHSAFMNGAGGLADLVVRGRLGVDCVEAGGPEPGIGCAGRGIGRMVTLLEESGAFAPGRYDVAVFDVLGDVVCGGFAAPLRQGLADKVVIVTSEELMALYAANNVARAVRNYAANGVALCGFVANLRDRAGDAGAVERLARRIGSGVIARLEREAAVREAEYRGLTLVEHAPGSPAAREIARLAEALLAFDRASARPPEPLDDEAFAAQARAGFADAAAPGRAPARPAASAPPRPGAPSPAAAPRPAPPASPRPPGGGPALEEELSWQTSLWEGEPGLNSQVWGAEDQWRRFHCDFETRRNVRLSLESRTPLVHVWHQDLECLYSTPNFEDSSLPSFYRFPWPASDAGGADEEDREEGGFGESLMTDLRDLDVIHGGGRRLDSAIAEAVRLAKGRAEAIVVHTTCVPTVIGDDAAAVVARWRKRTRIPILYMNQSEDSSESLDAGLLLFKELAGARAPRSRAARAVNLVGFPAGPGLEELRRLLEDCGLEVNACVMPRLRPAHARRYLRAPVQVLYPNGAYAATYAEFFESLPLRTIRPAAPYGFELTRAWLQEVAREFGLARAAAAACARAEKAARDDWERERRGADGHGVAFVLDARRLRRLTDPTQSWGVPLARFLREAGFAVDVLCYDRPGRPGARWASFKTPEELARLLREGPFQAVYSEYAYDERLTAAGKAQFGLDDFEMGYGGAARAAGRLSAVCRWPFRRRYAKYLEAAS